MIYMIYMIYMLYLTIISLKEQENQRNPFVTMSPFQSVRGLQEMIQSPKVA